MAKSHRAKVVVTVFTLAFIAAVLAILLEPSPPLISKEACEQMQKMVRLVAFINHERHTQSYKDIEGIADRYAFLVGTPASPQTITFHHISKEEQIGYLETVDFYVYDPTYKVGVFANGFIFFNRQFEAPFFQGYFMNQRACCGD